MKISEFFKENAADLAVKWIETNPSHKLNYGIWCFVKFGLKAVEQEKNPHVLLEYCGNFPEFMAYILHHFKNEAHGTARVI